jgi:hypothetical protein
VNNLDPWIDPRLSAVRPTDVRSYLVRQGWAANPYPRPELLVFEGPPADDGQPIVQILPASEEADDYRQRLVELISALAIIERRSVSMILDDLLSGTPKGQLPGSNGQKRRRPTRKS